MEKADRFPIETEIVRIIGAGGDEIPTYLARPKADGPFGGVIVLHSALGWEFNPKEITRTFAANGYIALMPNLHYRDAPEASPDDAAALVRERGGVPDEQCMEDVVGCQEYLRSIASWNRKIGLIGFCSGGRETYLAACRMKLDAGVFCYGGGITWGSGDRIRSERRAIVPVELTENLSCPVLGLFGRDDRSPSPDDAEEIRQALEEHGKTFELQIYDGTGHAYFNSERDTFRPVAVRDSWNRILTFYDRYLRTGS